MTNLDVSFINLLQCEPGFTTEKRIFDFDYLLYVHKGKGSYKIGSTSYSASMGDLFYCPPYVENTIMADEEYPFLLSGIDFRAPKYRDGMKKCYSLLSHRFLTEIIMEMVQEYRYGKVGSDKICRSLLTVLLENMQRMSMNDGIEKRDQAKEILDYIANNLHRTITHEEMSDVFSYHKSSINRILIRETGLSLKNYVLELRIRKAAELLKYSDKAIGEIGELCGYNSAVFFSRQFREKTGMTPIQFRDRRNLRHLK